MRKTLIALAAAAFTGLLFCGYLLLTESGPTSAEQAATAQDLPLQSTDIMPNEIGEAIVKVAYKSRYVSLDPQTKALSRVLGFETLLNPGSDSPRWQVEKPYIEFYESSYVCRMDSDRGTFTVEASGGSVTPTDAQLEGNVVIHIKPRPGGRLSETFIYLEDLVFSSERSEFSTDGPVRVVSDNTLLEGFGMILIFNTGTGRLEYLNIRDLEQLVLRNVVQPDQQIASGDNPEIQPDATAAALTPSASTTSVSQASAPDYYRCTLEDNVMIRYGKQLVVAGADNVSIQNIPLKSGSDASPSDASGKSTDHAPQPDAETGVRQGDTSSAVANADSSRDVVVTCDGGIIFEPMARVAARASASPLNVQMTGAPLRIKRLSETDADTVRQDMLVNCARLEYMPQEDVLRLFTNDSQPQITMNAQASNSRIETFGDVWWNRKTRTANVAGPGRIFLARGTDSASEPSEVNFRGAMDLLFDESAASSDAAIERINLTGGMDALLKEDGWYKTSAQTAQLDFGPENMLSQAFLDGSVRFESLHQDNPQRATSQSASFLFGPQNTLQTARMNGNVFFESREKEKTSQAAAQTAVFHFDNSKIQTADLQGQVRFQSEAGQFMSADATIDFAADATGAMKPGKVTTAGSAVLLAAVSQADELPAKFEARKIDYDLLTRSGLAHGPVRFTFYQQAEDQSSSVEPWIPVVITADENAQFVSDQNGEMERVIFNRNVAAVREFKSFGYTELNKFHGDKLTVFLSPGSRENAIREILMSEGKVFAEAIRTNGTEKLSHVRLNASTIGWSRHQNVILAVGPGRVELDNSHAAPTGDAEGAKSLAERPCFARLDGFDTLRWDLNAQTMTADGKEDTLQLAYVPLADGKPEKFLFANSVRFDVNFGKDATARTVVNRAFTDKGITFRELNADRSKVLNEVIGHTLDYSPVDGANWVRVSGTPAVPVYLNGARFPAVFVNVDTGKIETSLSRVPSVYSR
jgi:hypothetical protein